MPEKLLVKNGTLVTLGEENKLIDSGAVLIEDDKIKDFGKSSELEEKHESKQEIDADGNMIMPGFINAHHHLYSTFARGMSLPGEAPKNFEEILEKLWWKLDDNLGKEAIYYSAMVPLIECIKSGATTILDHHESQSFQKGSLDQIAKAVENAGIRASLCLGSSDRFERGEAGVKENERFLSKLQSEDKDLLHGMVGLHASFTVEDSTLNKSIEIANDYGTGIHVHCAEGKADQEKTLEKYGERVVERLDSHGALGEKSIAVHGIHVDEEELEILKETGTNLIHNPESNMNNAVGYADVPHMLEKGVRVGLGTDGMASDMLSQMRCAYLLHPHEKRDPRVGFSEAPEMLLENNPKIVENVTGWQVGEISKGNLADIITVDYKPPTPLSAENFLGHLIYGLVNAPVNTTICNGNILMKNGQLTDLDEEKIFDKASKVASEVWKEIQED